MRLVLGLCVRCPGVEGEREQGGHADAVPVGQAVNWRGAGPAGKGVWRK